MKRKTASAEPCPFWPYRNAWLYISLAITLVSKLPLVVVRTMSKTLSVAIVSGHHHDDQRRPDARHGDLPEHLPRVTPSSRAASTMSPGIALIAAESTTMAKPAWIQTMMTISSSVFSG